MGSNYNCTLGTNDPNRGDRTKLSHRPIEGEFKQRGFDAVGDLAAQGLQGERSANGPATAEQFDDD